MQSLEKVRGMPVKKLFPAHRDSPEDVGARIDELIRHHDERTAGIVQIMKDAGKAVTIFDVAIKMKWDLRKPLLESHPQQLWFACSETLSHLQSLWFKSIVKREERGGILYFSL
jgi:glyoxylase-like metal-dependent hydrolase (beta-lactamase superfamily II)